MKITFPSNKTFIKKAYHEIHCKFIVKMFEYCGHEIEYTQNYAQPHEVVCELEINGNKMNIDFGDHHKIHTEKRPLIKSHVNKWLKNSDVIPISPISFYDWEQYYSLQKEIKYSFGNVVLNNQTPGGNATQRRIDLSQMLSKEIKTNLDLSITDQIAYWRKINTAKIAVFAPGARIDILDRGQLQYMAFGCCTISPELNDKITFGKEPIAGVHYIKCKNDFSDVVDIIKTLDKEKCLTIGNNAKQLFNETCEPHRVVNYILSKMGINIIN